MKNIFLATYVEESSLLVFRASTYIMYNHYYIYEDSFININYENIKCLIIQVPSSKKIQKLNIDLYINGKKYQTDIYTKNKSDIFFYMNILNNQISLKSNSIFKYYSNYFYGPDINQNDFKISLSKALIKK